MHIRKLDLQGFKSFPDRTSFHFAPGVSGVVGPNGCGKSNVVDAIKWCLGEQSAKSLRGRSMDDVIFAGSQSRPAVGVAEVTITFAATGEPFPGEWARFEELQITRRLFRDGSSEYRINQNRVRLKDIHDVFKDTGAGNRLYSFIEQGRIGEIVRARPEQRRTLIEEAAGISRFKSKKKETEQRLDGTLRNLERATDVTEALSSQLRSLKRQVAKATRYRRYRTVVRQGEILLGLARFSGLVGDRRVLGERLREAEGQETLLQRELNRCNAGIAQEREAAQVLEAGVGRSRDQLAELEANRRERESARLYQGRESAQLLERIERLNETRSHALTDHAAAASRRTEAETEQQQMTHQVASVQTSADEARDKLGALETGLRETRGVIDGHKQRVLEFVRQLARDTAAREATRVRREDIDARKADLVFRIAVAQDGVVERADSLERGCVAEGEAEVVLLAAEAEVSVAQTVAQAAEQDRVRCQADLRSKEVARVEAIRSVDRRRTRIETLEALQAKHEGAHATVREALNVPGTLGTLADQLDVPEEMDDLVGTAIGDELEHILVPDAAVALAVAKRISGRVGMLLVPEMCSGAAGVASEIPGTALGQRALHRLLGDCEEVADLATALERHQADGRAYLVPGTAEAPPILVTARGEIRIGPATGGGTAQLQRRRELATLRSELPAIEKAMASAVRAVTEARKADENNVDAVRAGHVAVTAARAAASEAKLAMRDASAARERAEMDWSSRNEALVQLTSDLTAMDEEKSTLTASHSGLGTAIEAAQTDQSLTEEALLAEQVRLTEIETAVRDARQASVVQATELAAVVERLRGLEQVAAAARQAEDGAQRQLQNSERDIEHARQRIAEIAESDTELNQELQTIGEEQAEARARIEAGQKDVRALREGMREAEERIDALRDSREAATAQRVELERSIEQAKDEIGRIREQLDERYQVNVAAMLDRLDRNGTLVIEVPSEAWGPDLGELDPDIAPPVTNDDMLEDLCIGPSMLDDEGLLSDWIERLQHARERLERIGEVNLVAVQEYEEIRARFDQLEAQRIDLEESVRAIRNTIAQLNRTCRERFRETFERVNSFFQEGYPKLVGGGLARLVLTDEEDMLETGVDIEVQPPGKRLQNVSLLSGGETAMAAIALIFALFRVKPSPFCLLDEVDAPLDEANGARFNGLLRDMSHLSQFIVITHNKKTMECVDTLYGVTMQQPGVSQLVTVRLD
jgi:chromosome segregation protein